MHPRGELSEEDRRRARDVAEAMGPWTEDQLAELARIVDSVPAQPSPSESEASRKAGRPAS